MRAGDIAARLGSARRCANGWWSCRCPTHDDRKPSLSLHDGEQGLIVKCWAGCDRRVVCAELRRRGLIRESPEIGVASSPPRRKNLERSDAERIAFARQIWESARDPTGTPVELYLASRGLRLPDERVLRWSPQCIDGSRRSPAMLALVEHVERGVVGVHRTFLTRDNTGAWHRRDRKGLGPLSGGALHLAQPGARKRLVIAEGIETTLSVMIATGLPGWAALSPSGIASLVLPHEIQRVLIFADYDANGVGERAAWAARNRWCAEGRAALIARPPKPGDANDLLTSGGRNAGEWER